MRYLLILEVAGKTPEIDISVERYDQLKKAKHILTNCLLIEEKYEMLVLSFLEWENTILGSSLSNMVRTYSGYEDFFEPKLQLNLKLVSLLTTARLYVDNIHCHVREIVPDIKPDSLVKSFFKRECDDNAEYRFMEKFRNFVQHRGIPVHWLSYNSKWTDLGEEKRLEYTIELAAEKSILADDDKFNKKVLTEIPNRVDLKAYVRSYLESLSNVQQSIRELIEKMVGEARSLVEDAHAEYREVCDKDSLVGLGACIYDGNRKTESVPLFLEWDDIRIKLQRKNHKLINLRKRYVSSGIKEHNK